HQAACKLREEGRDLAVRVRRRRYAGDQEQGKGGGEDCPFHTVHSYNAPHASSTVGIGWVTVPPVRLSSFWKSGSLDSRACPTLVTASICLGSSDQLVGIEWYLRRQSSFTMASKSIEISAVLSASALKRSARAGSPMPMRWNSSNSSLRSCAAVPALARSIGA